MRKLLWIALLLTLCISSLAAQQVVIDTCTTGGLPACELQATANSSGTVIKIPANGGLTPSFEYGWVGSQSGVSTTVQGCGTLGNCDLLDTYSGSTATVRKSSQFTGGAPQAPYKYYLIISTWTGGSGTFTMDGRITTSRNAGSSGSGSGEASYTGTQNVLSKGSATAHTLQDSSVTDNGSGVTIGSPTGGPQGAGTLNATGVYANGSAIGGNVTGPGSATANDSAGFADGTGKVLQDTGVSEVGGVVKGSLLDKGGAQYNFKTLSPISDAVADATCSMDGSTANLTCADAPFSTCPVGAVVSVPNAATGGYSLTYGTSGSSVTVASCSSSTVAVLSQVSSNASGTQTAIWGTDNATPMANLLTAAVGSTANICPGLGSYVLEIKNANLFNLSSNTTYIGNEGCKLYLIGDSGNPSNTAYNWFTYPNGTNHIVVDGVQFYGENTNPSDTTYDHYNVIVATGSSDTNITDVTIRNTYFQDFYGFGHQHAGHGARIDDLYNTYVHVLKGLNNNSGYSHQIGNHFYNSGGIEDAGKYSTVANNLLVNSALQYAITIGGQTGANTPCYGIIAMNNVISALPPAAAGGIAVDDCAQRFEVSGNTIDNLAGSQIGIVIEATSYNNVGPGLVSNNLITGSVNTDVGIYSAGGSGGITTRNVRYQGNRTSGTMAYSIEPAANSGDELVGNNWGATSTHDIEINTETGVRVQGDVLTTDAAPNLGNGGTYSGDSFWVPTGAANTTFSNLTVLNTATLPGSWTPADCQSSAGDLLCAKADDGTIAVQTVTGGSSVNGVSTTLNFSSTTLFEYPASLPVTVLGGGAGCAGHFAILSFVHGTSITVNNTGNPGNCNAATVSLACNNQASDDVSATKAYFNATHAMPAPVAGQRFALQQDYQVFTSSSAPTISWTVTKGSGTASLCSQTAATGPTASQTGWYATGVWNVGGVSATQAICSPQSLGIPGSTPQTSSTSTTQPTAITNTAWTLEQNLFFSANTAGNAVRLMNSCLITNH
jgi:hypothetical protein